MVNLWHQFRCLMGWHDLWSYADNIYTMLIPSVDDWNYRPEEVFRKFKETAAVRCRHCSYRYDGDRIKSSTG